MLIQRIEGQPMASVPTLRPVQHPNLVRRPKNVILIVEDDAHTRDLLCRAFSWHYGRAAGAKDNAEALGVLRHEAVDLIVQDIFRPGGDGFDLLETLRASRTLNTIPVIVLSGWAERHDQRLRLLGAAAVLQKPVSRSVLVQTADSMRSAI